MGNQMRWVRRFDEGRANQKALLGGKGANLAEMTRLGLPVPPGFTVTTDACRHYLTTGAVPAELPAELDAAIADLEARTGRSFGSGDDPLMVSVRSGAPVSMPGMMDTVLNLGLTPAGVKGLIATTSDERFAHDAHRRLLDMYARVVLGISGDEVAAESAALCEQHGVRDAGDLPAPALATLAHRITDLIERRAPGGMPADPRRQLAAAVEAVFRSWNGRRARDYRSIQGIPDDLGTAVNVQVMAFGNLGSDSGTGVAFTRNPATGEPRAYGDFLVNAQGEDVVAGVRATESLDAVADHFPDCHTELVAAMAALEARYTDLCDIEFTIEHGKLWMLQVRVGQRTAQAAVRIAVDLVGEGLITRQQALQRVDPSQLERLLHPRFDVAAAPAPLTTGLGASPGAAVGHACFTADAAAQRAAAGKAVILIRQDTSPDDVHGIVAAKGVLTSRGGLVSHAAVVARGFGVPAVCGAAELDVDATAMQASCGDVVIHDDDMLSLDGSTGAVMLGEVPVVAPDDLAELDQLLEWADEVRRLGVRANADTGEDAARARTFGAEGIGLCRTEHQFLGERLGLIQRYLLAKDDGDRDAALAALHTQQVQDFLGLFEAMDGLPVTIRLLDPPLHEFLPDVDELLVAAALDQLDAEGQRRLVAAQHWREVNPMLGTRGVRLGLLRPELYRMQVRAIAEACVARVRAGGDPRPEVMIPLVAIARELEVASADVREVFDAVLADAGIDLAYAVGTMIETPRAALVAERLAETAEFFSFGTNDLTQMTFGFSRDDVEQQIMRPYLERNILADDPFRTLDVEGVGQLVRRAVEQGRATRPDLHVGICGEHGGDPASVAFCHHAGLDYVSCSPFRVRVARLAAARAALGETEDHEGE